MHCQKHSDQNQRYMVSRIIHAFLLFLAYDWRTDALTNFYQFYHMTLIDLTLLWVCTITDHRRRQHVVRTSVTHSAAPRMPLFIVTQFDVISGRLLNRHTASWNLVVNLTNRTLLWQRKFELISKQVLEDVLVTSKKRCCIPLKLSL